MPGTETGPAVATTMEGVDALNERPGDCGAPRAPIPARPSSSDDAPRVMLLGRLVAVDLDAEEGVSFLVRVPASEERARAVASLMLGGQRVEVTLPDTMASQAPGHGRGSR